MVLNGVKCCLSSLLFSVLGSWHYSMTNKFRTLFLHKVLVRNLFIWVGMKSMLVVGIGATVHTRHPFDSGKKHTITHGLKSFNCFIERYGTGLLEQQKSQQVNHMHHVNHMNKGFPK
jgi:hypothetical protein